MKKIQSLGIAVAAVALLAPLSASAESSNEGWYMGGGGMAVFQVDSNTKTPTVKDNTIYDAGWGLLGNAGYAFGNGIRTEGEIAYRSSDVDKIHGPDAGSPVDGTMQNVSFMANALYDIKTGTMLTPYVGVGIGASVVNADGIKTIDSGTVDDTTTQFAFQGIAGVSAALTDNLSALVDYRYFRTPDAKFEGGTPATVKMENASHNILVGLRYSFGKPVAALAPVAPAAMPMAPKAAQPVVAPVPQSYMVFFDFDKSVLTPEAKRIIASAAEDFKKGKYVRVAITGHTDTMGTVQYNQKLSDRRAAAVKAEFVKLGVPTAEIVTKGMGESSLLVPTNDQVREAQNRRAEIVFGK